MAVGQEQVGIVGVAWLDVAWLGVAWLCVAWLCVAWLGVVWMGVAWMGGAALCMVLAHCAGSIGNGSGSTSLHFYVVCTQREGTVH